MTSVDATIGEKDGIRIITKEVDYVSKYNFEEIANNTFILTEDGKTNIAVVHDTFTLLIVHNR